MPDYVELDGSTMEDLAPYVALSTTNYLCGYYGENSGNLDAPIDYQGHYVLAQIMAKSVFMNQVEKVNPDAKVEPLVEGFEKKVLTTVNDKYLEKGPDSLASEIRSTVAGSERTKLPNWLDSCTDVYNYTKATINQAIAGAKSS